MKKILLCLALLLGLVWTFQTLKAQAASEPGPAPDSDNYTVRVLTEILKDSSQEEIDAYFEGLSDETRICADKTGGFVYRSPDALPLPPGQPDAAVSVNQDGQEEVHDIMGPDSATVGQVKAALKRV